MKVIHEGIVYLYECTDSKPKLKITKTPGKILFVINATTHGHFT